MNGWRLVGLLSLLLLAMSFWLLADHAGDVEGIRLVIRATARTSLVCSSRHLRGPSHAAVRSNDVAAIAAMKR